MSGPLTVPWRPCAILPDGSALLRPIVPVVLTATTGRTVETHALIDSGADWSIASVGLLPLLGLEPKDCEVQLDTVNGVGDLTYRAPVALVIAETFTIRFALRFRAWDLLDVAGREGTAMVLGSQDVMKVLRIGLDYGTTTLEPREPGVKEWEMPHDVLEAAA